MAPLAERLDVAVPPPAMGRVMVEVGCRQHHPGRPDRRSVPGRGGRGELAALAVPPDPLFLVPPAAVAQMAHHGTMRSAADLAATLGPHEPDPVADLLLP